MAQVKKRSRVMIHRQRLGDVPELIHRIQVLLPTKDAARTCILSKSWLHAWSTIPAIRFSPSVDTLKKQHQRKYMRWIYRTLLRYHRDKLPITSLDLQFGIHTAFRSAYKLIMQATSSKSLKELHLAIKSTTSFTLPDEIFSSENLHTLSLKLIYLSHFRNSSYSLHFSSNPSIHCTNLRVLKLLDVHITQYVLHKLLSTCKLLQKIDIELPVELRIIKVNNLRYLDELRIYNLSECDNIFQVDNVPSLRSLVYDTFSLMWFRPVLFKLGTIRSLRELTLDNVSMDDSFSSMIKSNFPFLESLTLMINWCSVEILDIRCLSLRTLRLHFELDNQIKVQVYAPNLLVYSHASTALPPSLLFPTIPPQQIELSLRLNDPVDDLFFLNMREALELSSKFNVTILSSHGVLVPFDIDDVRTILPFPPATSVEELVFIKQLDTALWENSLLFDAVFSICHPMYVKANNELNLKVANYLLNQLMVKENEIGKVVYCEIRNPLNGRWVALTSSSLSLLDTTTLRDCGDRLKLTEFKLSWYNLIYPQGCDVCNHLSLFLCVADHDKLLPCWGHFAQFTIAVTNKDPKKSKYSGISIGIVATIAAPTSIKADFGCYLK